MPNNITSENNFNSIANYIEPSAKELKYSHRISLNSLHLIQIIVNHLKY